MSAKLDALRAIKDRAVLEYQDLLAHEVQCPLDADFQKLRRAAFRRLVKASDAYIDYGFLLVDRVRSM